MSQEPRVPSGETSVSRRDAMAMGGVAAAALVGAAGAAAQGQEKQAFRPNACTFAEGIEAIKKAVAEVDGWRTGEIITSRDAGADKLREALRITNIPSGFTKYHLPVFFEGGPGAQFFVSIGSPNIRVPRHSHDEGDGYCGWVN